MFWVAAMEQNDFFTRLGLRYRRQRIEKKVKLRTLAARCGISVDTLRAIERGGVHVKIGSWFAVARALDLAGPWQGLLVEQRDPFEEYDRQRASEEQLMKARVRS